MSPCKLLQNCKIAKFKKINFVTNSLKSTCYTYKRRFPLYSLSILFLHYSVIRNCYNKYMRAVIVSSAGSADRPSPAHQQQLFSIGQSCSCLAS